MIGVLVALPVVLLFAGVPPTIAQQWSSWEHRTEQSISIRGEAATVSIPEGWRMVREDEAVDESGHCRIQFTRVMDTTFNERVPFELEGDSLLAAGSLRKEVMRTAGHDSVHVHYVDGTGRRISKVYFDRHAQPVPEVVVAELIGDDTSDGRSCESEFAMIASSLHFALPAASSGE